MAGKKKVQDGKGTSGGAAASGGVGFQQSVAAYALAHVLVGDTALQSFHLDRQFKFRSLHLESADEIDDVVIVGESHRALIQAKTNVSLSDLEGSMYGKALRQFVTHHVHDGRDGDAYILATSTDSSRRIVVDLTRLTESARLSSLALKENPLTAAEEEVLSKTRALVLSFLADAGVSSPSEEKFLEIFRRLYVLPLDIEPPRGRDLNSALLLLRGKAVIESNLLWAALTQLARSLMNDRGSIDKAGLDSRLGHHVDLAEHQKTLLEEVALEVVTPDNPSVGTDVVVFYAPGQEDNMIVISASERFDGDGSKTTVFSRDGFKYRDGTLQHILCRSATSKGAARFLSENQHLVGNRTVAAHQFHLTPDRESNGWAQLHKQFLRKLFTERRAKLTCLVCGDPVSEDGAQVVEVDEEGAQPAAGVTHKRCQYPGLRILGELHSPLFAQYNALRDFDFNRWIEAARKGASILSSSVVQGTATMLWNSRLPGQTRGQWCVRVEASDGTTHYVSNRGKVLRFTRDEAEIETAEYQRRINTLAAAGDPHCVSEDRQYAGSRTSLLERLPRGTTILQCLSAYIVPFDLTIEKAYSNPGQYYAPVSLLVAPERGDPLELDGSLVFLTNPFKILAFLDNWRQAGIELPSIAAEVIDTDVEFDRIVCAGLAAGKDVLADPLFDTKGVLVSGIKLQENTF